MDRLAERIANFGVPGLVVLVAVSATGYTGAAAVTTSLAALGGPLGMLGGVALLGLIGVISGAIARYGFEKVFETVVEELIEEGHTEEEMIGKIEDYPVSKELKLKLKELISDHFEGNNLAGSTAQ